MHLLSSDPGCLHVKIVLLFKNESLNQTLCTTMSLHTTPTDTNSIACPFLSSPFYPSLSSKIFSSFPSLSFPPPSVSLLLNPRPPIGNPLLYQLHAHLLFWFSYLAHLVFMLSFMFSMLSFSRVFPCHASYFPVVRFLIYMLSSSSSSFSFSLSPPPRCRASTPMTQPIFKMNVLWHFPPKNLE